MDFEFKSKLDKHPMNCKIYTDSSVADKLIKCLDIDWNSKFRLLEPAVGKSDILINIFINFLESKYTKNSSKEEIEKKILKTFYAYDVDQKSIEFSLERINLLLRKYNVNVDLSENIICMNIFDLELDALGKFDYIVSNPPYISIKKLEVEQRKFMRENFKTCKLGSFDIYYAFFEKSLSQLSDKGRMVFITPNSFLNNKSGTQLRDLISSKYYLKKVFNYPSTHLFSNAQVKTCITVIDTKKTNYTYFEDDKLICNINFVDPNNFILSSCEPIGIPVNTNTIDNHFKVVGGIATFKDKFFIINDTDIIKQNNEVTTFLKESREFQVESKILKKLIKPNKSKKYFVIFPYEHDGSEIPIDIIKKEYPLFYNFHENYNTDKSIYFGRTQSINLLSSYKLVIPQFWTTDKFIVGDNFLVSAGITFIRTNPKASFEILKKSLSYGIRLNKNNFKRNSKNTYTLTTTLIKKMEYLEGESYEI